MSNIRRSAVAGRFYPASKNECVREIDACCESDAFHTSFPDKPVAGIVPHAGWMFSGPTAGKVFSYIKNHSSPSTFIIFGGSHRMHMSAPAVLTKGVWETPLGDVEIDSEAAAGLIASASCSADTDPALHAGEHSIEVEIPFIKHLFPEAKIVPVLVPHGPAAIEIGRAAAKLILSRAGGDAIAVASTDLTHYGYEYGFAPKGTGNEALEWVRDVNDRRFIDNAKRLDAEAILTEAKTHHNACGAGAAAAAVETAKNAGATKAVLLEYTTSHDVVPSRIPEHFVGYAGMVM